MTIRERFEKLQRWDGAEDDPDVWIKPADDGPWLKRNDVLALADEIDRERERQTSFLRKLLHDVERLNCMGAGPLRNAIEAELHSEEQCRRCDACKQAEVKP